ncbi:hypothetical protein E4U59_007756 [Claviceps monticola]|nr:hypothetical protein E4U59_007756 [Claviceps monticola]
MSLSRAFTTRRLRGNSDVSDVAKMPQRSHTFKNVPHDLRNKISAPIQLIHTTNMLSYNAPDIPRTVHSKPATRNKSVSDADSHSTSYSTPPTSPEVGAASEAPEPNHLSCYFKTSGSPNPAAPPVDSRPPVIPARSPSHTKKNSFDAIARQRQRSLSRASRDSDQSSSIRGGQTFSRSPSTTSTRASSASHTSSSFPQKVAGTPLPPPLSLPSNSFAHSQAKEPSHPFGLELAQVTELAEEYTANNTRLNVIDEEEQFLYSRGLRKFSADDYQSAIQSLAVMLFPERRHVAPAPPPLWI